MKLLFRVCLLLLASQAAPVFADNISKALEVESRSIEDKKLDPLRHPDGVLRFLGVEADMAAFDIFAGGGYYTEILSHVVGPKGRVVHYNNEPWMAFVDKETEKRFADGRLPNVTSIVAPPESLLEQAPEYDVAIFIMGMHDIYYADPENAWTQIDNDKFLKGIFGLLKPGGVLGVIDHNALPGTDPKIVGKSIHRIDPAILIADLTAAGFVLEDSSELLANPEDDKTTSVFLPENRYKTDRSLLKFRKPR